MSTEGNTSEPEKIEISLTVRFWIILPFEVPSVICSLFILFRVLAYRVARRALHNHVLTVILLLNLIIQLTAIPWALNYYRSASVWPATPSFCLTWMFIDEALYITITFLVAWTSIERHILIFHDSWLTTTKKLILLHILPIITILCYCLVYNFIIIIFPPCENTFSYSDDVCGSPLCFYDDKAINFWDVLFHDIIPTVIIIIFSVGLILRVIYKRYSMNRPVNWRKHRKMAIQLLSLSLMYLIIYMPKMILEFAQNCGLPESYGAEVEPYLEFFETFGHLLLPFICTGSLPELQTTIKRMLPCCRRSARAVEPGTFTLSRIARGTATQLQSRRTVFTK